MTSPSRGDRRRSRRRASGRAGTRRRRRRAARRPASTRFGARTWCRRCAAGGDRRRHRCRRARSSADASRVDVQARAAPSPPAGSERLERRPPRGRSAPPPASTSPNRPSPPARRAAASNRGDAAPRRRRGVDVEQLVEPGAEARDAVVAQAANDPVGRQDGQRLVGRLEEQHQQIVERRVLLAGAAHPPLVAVAERGLVAVVPVGDRDRARRPRSRASVATGVAPRPVGGDRPTGDGARRRRRRGRPPAAPRRARRARLRPRPLGSSNSADDRARVDAGRAQQAVAVLRAAGQGPLVRQDAGAGPERLEARAGRRSRAASARRPCRGRDRSARRRRSTGAGSLRRVPSERQAASVRAARR